MAIAGIRRATDKGAARAFTMLTVEPGPDVKPYHDREIVVLRPEGWFAWLTLSKSEKELLRPLPAGSLHVETVQGGSD